MKSILNKEHIAITIKRLAQQIIENHTDLSEVVMIGLQPRGVYLSDRMHQQVKQLIGKAAIHYGKLDITFYRDDVRNSLHTANATDIPFSIENKTVILIDDVLYTGRTIRAALDALLDFGRPAKVELCVLIDRRFSREVPIQADYIGSAIDSFENQKVLVRWVENSDADQVYIE
ncbi:bifunctional pyr operon transcriptional regulator/uracil phosphoribosyltransferase PyrR [Niabella sp. W65]|nr:bifunctional pyr operon transcriptional regulator/uracil phosphoribosyltransferase PyrR [Niabella sp. W65]MCH7367166.1 bifunctional pyr operon transcriptional regulator/uracil phosphoribosyltransferase PyrR [Niabella sp. W65]ULT42838.1 bifunctional pyr operon transcriptional regulator/uracil phosphoribosyltransferase PyrR [Niabella sp. I65]